MDYDNKPWFIVAGYLVTVPTMRVMGVSSNFGRKKNNCDYCLYFYRSSKLDLCQHSCKQSLGLVVIDPFGCLCVCKLKLLEISLLC